MLPFQERTRRGQRAGFPSDASEANFGKKREHQHPNQMAEDSPAKLHSKGAVQQEDQVETKTEKGQLKWE